MMKLRDINLKKYQEKQRPKEHVIAFISYDGSYPNLCSGTLVISIDNKEYTFEHGSLSSGGSITNNYEDVNQGPWSVYDWPEDPIFDEPNVKETVLVLINDNIREGCCGGCI